MFQIKAMYKITTHIFCSVVFFFKWCSLWDNLEKYFRAEQCHRWQYGACA